MTQYHYWCGSSSSPYYNQLVDERVADRKHTSDDEYLINYKGVYNYCLFIGYNADGTLASGKPCLLCRRMLRNAMVAEAVYREPDGTVVHIAPKDIKD